MIERKYGTADTISFPLIAFSLTSYHTSVTSTMFAAGDVKIAKDFGDFTNATNTPAGVPAGTVAVFTLTAAELQAKHIDVQIIDQTASKIWEDQMFQVETFGDTTASQFGFDRSVNTVQASLTAAQTGVTVATVTDITNAVNASITSTSVVQSVTNTVSASLTAAQVGVTIATVTDITNAVNASITSTSVVQSVTNAVTITSTIPSETTTANAIWNTTQSAFGVAGTFGNLLDATMSGFASGGDWSAAEKSEIRFALGVTGSTTAGSGGIIQSISSLLTTNLDVVLSTRSSHSATDAASAIHNATITSTSFAADTHGERLTAIDNKLPTNNISDFTATTAVTITSTVPSATTTANAVWNTTQSAFGVAGTFGNQADVTVSSRSTFTTTSAVTSTAVVVASITTTAIISNLGGSATAQINAEMVDVMTVDTVAEQSLGIPPAAPTFAEMNSYLYMAWRNKIDTTAARTSVTNDAGATIASAAVSDDATTFTKAEFA